MTSLTTEQRVATGAELLNEKKPGWFRKIDLEKLNQSVGTKCVLGQLYGTYGEGTDELFGWEADSEKPHKRGFYNKAAHLDPFNCSAIYAEDTAEWKRVINKLRMQEDSFNDIANTTQENHVNDAADEPVFNESETALLAAALETQIFHTARDLHKVSYVSRGPLEERLAALRSLRGKIAAV